MFIIVRKKQQNKRKSGRGWPIFFLNIDIEDLYTNIINKARGYETKLQVAIDEPVNQITFFIPISAFTKATNCAQISGGGPDPGVPGLIR